MAIYFLGVKSIGRSAGPEGRISTRAAAYRSGETIRDERRGETYNHSERRDIEYKEILLPSALGEPAKQASWARDRSELWNMVELAEPRRNARVAREYIVALPHELKLEQRNELARAFAQVVADRYRNVVDLAVHQPRTDPRNFHAHLLTTTREISESGLGGKTIAELSGSQRFELGLPRAMQEHAHLRAHWAGMANDALRSAGLDIQISHIPDEERILQPGAKAWLPRVAWEIEKRGGHSILGDRAREQFALRQSALNFDGPKALDQGGGFASSVKPRGTPEDIRNAAIEEWRSLRQGLRPERTFKGGRQFEAELDSPFRPSAEDLQMDALRRELGRDDFGL